MISRPLSLVGRRELFLFLGAYLVYSMSRYVSVGDISTATGHAEWIVHLQQSIGVNVESSVQSALDGTIVIWILNNLYLAAQLVVVPGTLIWLYRRDHALYVRLRNTVLATWLIAMPIYALFPVAPPRARSSSGHKVRASVLGRAGRITRACPSGASTLFGWSRAWCCTSARSWRVGAAGTR